MQITLNQAEIMSALDAFVRKQITISDDQKIDIDMKAGRGENGYSAELSISAQDISAPAKPAKVTRAATPYKPTEVKADETPEAEADEPETDTVADEPTTEDSAPDEKPKSNKSIFSKAS